MNRLSSAIEKSRTGVGYIPALDGLRAIACLLVMIFHAAPAGPLSGGFLGVDIFFVLSGYLITNLLLAERQAEGKIDIGRFYRNRALRLFPALALFLAAYLAVAPFVWPGAPHLRDAGLVAVYAGNYTYPLFGSPNFLRHGWSLAVEEQFYLVWPLLIPLLTNRRRALFFLVSAWAGITLLRYSAVDEGWIAYYYPFHTHSSGLIVGAALALLRREGYLKISAPIGTTACLAFAWLALSAQISASAATITVAEILSFLIIGCIVSGEKPAFRRLLEAAPMVRIGRLSYALYLWHFPIACYVREETGFIGSVTITLSLSFAGALLSDATVEKWARSVKRNRDDANPAATADDSRSPEPHSPVAIAAAVD